MKKILYITNIEVPYKVKFFNQLAEKSELTVLYERQKSGNRNEEWSKSIDTNYKKIYLNGLNYKNENVISLSIFRYLSKKYDEIIISCFNSPVQLMAMLYMRMMGMKYTLSFDGEIFVGETGFKNKLKKFFIKGAEKYLTAGEVSAANIRKLVGNKSVYPYYFSSFDKTEIKSDVEQQDRDDYVLVVGQYFDYKGLDIAVKIAMLDQKIRYKFVGMGKRTNLFLSEQHVGDLANVEVISFLQKEDLNKAYKEAAVLLLPSRKECWGLVINEAASFGTPIISTEGSGAAVEFLSPQYEKYLFKSDDYKGILDGIREILGSDIRDYSEYLINKSRQYSIERMVESHVKALDL
ncbi:Glycosyl transferases group 1 [Pseudobutyrivibrio sp. UC1225]|uniref:glycosyltransferase family 4 protein n=1 Tax=Pseudobutyrivibrio sp. UC1225 TaxID=1798185 RepID=UPI0008E62454|nr:glycosyltransferase family 4 protein [Pseudobutyrivibrio sp. UC1225]SFO26680.1 Glycosyl transferases group 1 [Pseudobutyrivibrio sp. UC1225]